MGLIDVFFIAIGLSMNAFAVSICKGLKMKQIDVKQMLTIAGFFGFFQAMMPLAGYFLSVQFTKYIYRYSHWIAFVLLAVIGINMIKESMGETDDQGSDITKLAELFTLAIATSIDALAVGVTFGTMGDQLYVNIIVAVVLIGITTFILSIVGVLLGNAFGIRYKSKAELAGGIILIAIGLKIVIEHYL